MKNFKKIMAMMIVVVLAVMVFPISAGAATIKKDDNVSINVDCSKKGYTFEIYQVATLVSTTSNPYETKYKSNVPEVDANILAGDSKTALSTLDGIETLPSTAKSYGTFDTDKATTKTFSNLPQGIYYIKAIEYPADVKKIENSILALPYYTSADGWVYSYKNINLAEKVVEGPPETHKIITNSTKDNVNFTDVSLGDTVDFELVNTITGSKQIRLTKYTVYDEMSKGLTLNKNSFKVYLADANNKKLSEVTDFKMTVTAEGEGKDTSFNVALSGDFLKKDAFYEADKVLVDYSAVLNKHSVIGKDGNPNTITKLEYGNRSKTAFVKGNTVYVYTYVIGATKYDENKNYLEGAKFNLYKTEADGETSKNAFAVGISDKNGRVDFYTVDKNEPIRLQSGTYYMAETEAPEGYNLYGKVIKINIDATYFQTITQGTYVNQCPSDGRASVSVTNFKGFTPKTGGHVMQVMAFGVGLVVVSGGILAGLFFYKKKKKNAEK